MQTSPCRQPAAPARRRIGMFESIINPRTIFMSVGAVFAGTASDVLRGNMEILPASLCLLFAIFAQIGGNASHRYFDYTQKIGHRGGLRGDEVQPHRDSEMYEFVMRKLGTASLMMAVLVGLALLTIAGWWGLALAALIGLLEWLANYGPKPLMRTPWAALVTFLLFGPVCVLGTSMVQSQHEATAPYTMYDLEPAFYLAVIMGVQAVECHWLFNYFNYDNDIREHHRNFATTFGRRTVRLSIGICTVIPILAMLAMGSAVESINSLSAEWLAYLAVPLICMCVNIYIIMRMPKADSWEQPRLRTLMCAKMGFCGVATFISFLFIATPDDSQLLFF